MKTNVATLGFAALTIAVGCGDDDAAAGTATQQRACNVICDKLDECGFTFGRTREQCVSGCLAPDDSGSSDTCEVSESEANACISSVQAAECSAFTSGTLPECDFCPDTASDGGTSGLGDSGFGGFDASNGSGGGCAELRTCCGELPAGAQDGCNTTADTGDDEACGVALSTFRSTGLCS